MGLPKFPDSKNILSREEAINAILTSIAMEETALSHILTAESEKIQFAIERADKQTGCNMCTVLKINKSVTDMLDKVNDMQILLKSKLRIAASFLPDIDPPCPPDPPVPPPKPCISVFVVPKEYCWYEGTMLKLETHKSCNNGVRLEKDSCNRVILLPPGKTFKISLEMKMESVKCHSSSVEMALGHDKCITHAKIYCHDGKTSHFNISDTQIWETSKLKKQHFIVVRLTMPEIIKVLNGKIMITEQKDALVSQ